MDRGRFSREITCLAMAIEASLVMDILPDFGFSSPMMRENIELFPAPFCPIKVILEFLRTLKLASFRIGELDNYYTMYSIAQTLMKIDKEHRERIRKLINKPKTV